MLTLCSSSVFALDPNQTLSQLYHTSWNAKQGISGNVTALAQTADGYLWLGTTDGLLRFDGITFEKYQPEDGPLIARNISALMPVPGGGLWVGFALGGATFISNGRATNYSDSEGLPVSTVRCFALDSSGTVWAAVVGGLARLEGQRWQLIQEGWNYPSRNVWGLLVDRDGTLWATTGSEIVFLPKREKRFQTTGIQTGKVTVLTQTPDGAILFYDDVLKMLRAFRRNSEHKIEFLPDLKVNSRSLLFDRDGKLWVGGDGLTRVSFPTGIADHTLKQQAERFTEADGLSNESVEVILEDRESNIWVGTDGGLDRFRHRNVTWFPLRGRWFTLVAGTHGDVWAGARGNSALVRVQDGKLAAGGPTDVFAAYQDADGSVWFGANNSLLHWKDGRFSDTPLPRQVRDLSRSASPPDPIVASGIAKDRSGKLWVAFGGSGEFRFENGVWSFVPILPDHPDWSAGYAFADSADRLWLSWGDRIARYDHGDVEVFATKGGLAIGPPRVIAGADGDIWIGGESGLSLFQGGRFHTIQTADGAGFSSIRGLVVVANGGLWLSTSSGVVHIPESEVQNVNENPDHKVAFELFDLVSDLPEPLQQGADNYSNGAIQASDGAIWFATQKGAVRVDPTHIYRNPLPPPLSIRSITADDKSYSSFSSPTLPSLTRDLRIEFTALSLSIPERVRFRYKLEGWDNEWHDAGARREAFFTRLAPAHYTFRVIACNNDGVWNEMGATLHFTVSPAWFQTNWFRTLCVAVLLLLLWTVYRLRLKQLEQRFRLALEVRVNERTRIARDLHDTLLQSFQGLLLHLQAASNHLSAHPDETKRKLDAAIDQASQAIAEGRSAVEGLRSSTAMANDLAISIKTLGEELIASSENRQPPAFDVAVEGTPRVITPIVRDELYRIAGEALRNAFLHAKATRIEVDLHYDAHDLGLRIRDNGKGIESQVLRNEGRAGHFGLRGMRERANIIGANLVLWSDVGSGTEVELTIPASHAYDSHVRNVPARPDKRKSRS